ncbi:MAG TPA: metalloregulator ArsR/SmtB family transcription factor [Solirubrobacteraceae bacterium]|nr:metalloregulator ArsR/SmtB family transcription factor [Solirubrobacteraceae bacterium]
MTIPDTDLRAILFHGFSDRSRLRILEALAAGELRVGDVVATTGLSQPNASMHLACLWDCGLVARERRGREVYYRLAEGVADVFAAADRVLERTGETVRACPRYGRGQKLEAA